MEIDYPHKLPIPIKTLEVFIALAKKENFKLEKRIKRIVPRKAIRFAKEDKTEEILIFKK